MTDLALSVVYVEGLTLKYAFMAFIHQTASSVSPEKSARSAALILAVQVVVDIVFAGGEAGGCGGGTVGGGMVVGLVVDTVGGTVVTRWVTGGRGLVTGMLSCELEDGKGVMCFGDKGKDAGFAVY